MQAETQKQQGKKAPANVPAETKANVPVITQDFADGGWDAEVVDNRDLIIPKILLMHPMSDLVKEGKRNQGEIIKSTNGDLIAKRGETVDVIVFAKWKEWRVMEKNKESGRYEFDRLEQWTEENDLLPWDFEEDGKTMRRDKTLNFYAILAKEAEEGKAYPVKLSFVRTGFRTGHKLADCYTRAIMEKQAPTRQIFKLGTELVKGSEETYFAFTIAEGPATNDAQKKNALFWRQMVNQAQKNNTIRDHEETDNEPVAKAATQEF